MEQETKNIDHTTHNMEQGKRGEKSNFLSTSILCSAIILAGAWIYTTGQKTLLPEELETVVVNKEEALEKEVFPKEVTLPVIWGDLGKRMVESGVIDGEKFESLYTDRGELSEEYKKLLYGEGNGKLRVDGFNAGYVLNLLWALGLGNKSDVLEKGPMSDPAYGGAENFASTGGWTLAKGDAMDHYSKHNFITLTAGQQSLVERVSKNVYRPCCGNSTYFPDCNHGMAMLGLLELMASQGVSESDMYKYALAMNSYWFADTYMAIAQYKKERGIPWSKVDPKEVLGADFSSSRGIQRIMSEITPLKQSGGGSCGV